MDSCFFNFDGIFLGIVCLNMLLFKENDQIRGSQKLPSFNKKGTTIEVQEIITISAGETWGRTVDGYVALKYGGNWYVE